MFVKSEVPSTFDKVAYRKEYYQRNKARKNLYSIEWGRKNKVKRKIIKDRWRAKNKERTNFLTRAYHYRKKSAKGNSSFEEIQELKSWFSKCAYCNQKEAKTIDHIIPLSRGGTNDIENMIPVCVSCNSKKGAKTLIEYDPMLWLQFNYLARKYV